MSDAIIFMNTWLPQVTENDKITIVKTLTSNEKTFGNSLLQQYMTRIAPYNTILGVNSPREPDYLASGIVFFYGCLFYIMHFKGWENHIDDILSYNLLYMLVDHYIDDNNVPSDIKKIAIGQMFILIYNPMAYENMQLVDPILKTIAITYHKLVQRCPLVKQCIIKLFNSEVIGLQIQKQSNLDREKYYNIASDKGGYTILVLQAIIGNIDESITTSSYHIGTIMQLIDDVADCTDDNNNGIHTIATFDLHTKGTLDDLWMDIIHRISTIDRRFTIFMILYAVFAVYLPERNKEHFSTTLCSHTTKHNLFNFNGSSLLVNALMNEIK